MDWRTPGLFLSSASHVEFFMKYVSRHVRVFYSMEPSWFYRADSSEVGVPVVTGANSKIVGRLT